jgi:hypothetical protein
MARGPKRGSVVRPQGHGALGFVEDQLGIDLHLRLGNLARRPLADEGARSRWRQPPQPLMGIPVAIPAAPAAGFGQHRRLGSSATAGKVDTAKLGGLAAVGEAHPEAQEGIPDLPCRLEVVEHGKDAVAGAGLLLGESWRSRMLSVKAKPVG